jgi:RNA polymerase sigma-70 factor, ECF subfamily
MSVTVAETKPAEQLEDALGSNALEMTTMITERLPYFRRIAMLRLDNAADAEDAVQDALLAAWRHLDQFRGQARMSTWLTAIVMNSSRTIIRRRPRVRLLPIDAPDENENRAEFLELLPDGRPDPETQFRNSEYERRLHQLFARLPPALQIVVRMRIFEGMGLRETAKALGITESAVKSRAFRALAELRRLHQGKSRRSARSAIPCTATRIRSERLHRRTAEAGAP